MQLAGYAPAPSPLCATRLRSLGPGLLARRTLQHCWLCLAAALAWVPVPAPKSLRNWTTRPI